MAIVVVTGRAYLMAEAINHICLYTDGTYLESPNGKEMKYVDYYSIDIDFIPIPNTNANNNRRDDNGFVSIRVIGEKVAKALYTEIVKQIRDQIPDQKFLDDMLSSMLLGHQVELCDESLTREASSARRSKRNGKKISKRLKGFARGTRKRKRKQ